VGEPGDPSDEVLVAADRQRRADDEAVFERAELEWATTRWPALLPATAGPVELLLRDSSRVAGECVDVGHGWCLLAEGGRWHLVSLDQVVTLVGAQGAAPLPGQARRGMGWALRRWTRMHASVSVRLVTGERLGGLIAEVLADAVVLLVELEPRQRVVIPLAAMVSVSGDPIPG
jgi:hypothetical protein